MSGQREAITHASEDFWDKLLTQTQAAERLNVSVTVLQEWRKRGTGPPFVRLGQRTHRYVLGDIEAWLRERRIDPEQARDGDNETSRGVVGQ